MDVITRLEEAILMAVWRLGDNAYGVSINKEVSKRTGKEYSMGALYFSLDQLHKKELLVKTAGSPTPERGGRSKVYYQLTSSGEKALQAARKMQESIWADVPKYAFNRDK